MERRRERKREQNRIAQKLHRDRQASHVSHLEAQVKALEARSLLLATQLEEKEKASQSASGDVQSAQPRTTSVAEELLKENKRFKEGLASIEKDLLRLGYALSGAVKQNGELQRRIRELPASALEQSNSCFNQQDDDSESFPSPNSTGREASISHNVIQTQSEHESAGEEPVLRNNGRTSGIVNSSAANSSNPPPSFWNSVSTASAYLNHHQFNISRPSFFPAQTTVPKCTSQQKPLSATPLPQLPLPNYTPPIPRDLPSGLFSENFVQVCNADSTLSCIVANWRRATAGYSYIDDSVLSNLLLKAYFNSGNRSYPAFTAYLNGLGVVTAIATYLTWLVNPSYENYQRIRPPTYRPTLYQMMTKHPISIGLVYWGCLREQLIRHYNRLDLETFLQQMPDYLVAETDRYAVRVAPYYYSKLGIVWPGPKRHDDDIDALLLRGTEGVEAFMKYGVGDECSVQEPDLADFFRLGLDDAANWKLDRQYLEPYPFLINDEVARILTTRACARPPEASQRYPMNSTAAVAATQTGQPQAYVAGVQHHEGGGVYGSSNNACVSFQEDSLDGFWGLQGPDEERLDAVFPSLVTANKPL